MKKDKKNKTIKSKKQLTPRDLEMIERGKESVFHHLECIECKEQGGCHGCDIENRLTPIISALQNALIERCAEIIHPEDFEEGSDNWCILKAVQGIIYTLHVD